MDFKVVCQLHLCGPNLPETCRDTKKMSWFKKCKHKSKTIYVYFGTLLHHTCLYITYMYNILIIQILYPHIKIKLKHTSFLSPLAFFGGQLPVWCWPHSTSWDVTGFMSCDFSHVLPQQSFSTDCFDFRAEIQKSFKFEKLQLANIWHFCFKKKKKRLQWLLIIKIVADYWLAD